MENNQYMNPFTAGILLGLLLLLTIFITGRGLGASGAVKSAVIGIETTVATSHTENMRFYEEYNDTHAENPLKSFLVFEVIGVLIGAFISGMISNRLKFTLEKGDGITSKTRIAMALLGGALFGFGAQFGRGCTSGAALSGMGVFSTGGILTMFAIFGGAYAFAYFFRKLWLN
ncbi:MAG: YeeE/YedE family protein [Melioribacteraceae bacterium]|nr:YeeE/YedE family protein [Melioribacteraceae bacterium]